MLDTAGLTVAYGGVRPLEGLDLHLDAGICGIVGPNGAGKTTLFNVISGFVRPMAGSVRLFGEDLAGRSPHRRARWGLRRTFARAQVVDDLTVAENVALSLEHTGGLDGATVGDVLEHVGCASGAERPGRELSVRERRLVEIARAIVGRPRMVLLDEPGAGLSEHETGQLAEIIGGIPAAFGARVVLIDHDMRLVAATCEQVAVLDFGQLLAVGPCGEVLADDRVRQAYLGRGIAE